MAAQFTDLDDNEHKTARSFGSQIGRLVAKVTRNRGRQMPNPAGQQAVATARNAEQERSETETNTDLAFRMQPLSRRPVKIRVLAYREAEPHFVFEDVEEESAAAQ